MGFKISKEVEKPMIKMANFRLPESLLEELKGIAEKEEISLTELVKQMLRFCVDDYKRKKAK